MMKGARITKHGAFRVHVCCLELWAEVTEAQSLGLVTSVTQILILLHLLCFAALAYPKFMGK